MKFCKQEKFQIKDTNFFLKQSGVFINKKRWPDDHLLIFGLKSLEQVTAYGQASHNDGDHAHQLDKDVQ